MIKIYRKKPIRIRAVQFTKDNIQECIAFTNFTSVLRTGGSEPFLIIPTLEGDHIARLGDYIVCGVHGEFYPCKPDIFEKTYEEA